MASYFRENDLIVKTVIFSEHIERVNLVILSKLWNHSVHVKSFEELVKYLQGNEDEVDFLDELSMSNHSRLDG